MKRKNEKVPEFDEIIFENRNKTYGAYDLRKRYKSATGLSILTGVAFCTGLLIILSILNQNEVNAKPDKEVIVILKPDNLQDPLKVKPPEPEKPVSVPVQNKYVAPDIVDDSVQITETILINDYAVDLVKNGKFTDTDTATYVPVSEIPVEPETFYRVEEMPEFPGGDAALLNYIGANTRYPDEAVKNNIRGKVIIRFVVTSEGTVSRVGILRGIDTLLNNEAIRVVASLPRWTPGKQNGKPVPVWYFVPVNFQLKFME